jgi:riboflavin biosynthesis pyrimidine reductase
MTLSRYKKVLFVTPETDSPQLNVDYKNIKYIHAVTQIFPSIYELNPNLIVLDHTFLLKEMEKVVRRIRTNTFYNKIKICCYKNKVEPKADSLLKAIGVDYFIYEEELQNIQKSKNITGIFNEIMDRSVLHMLTNVSS